MRLNPSDRISPPRGRVRATSARRSRKRVKQAGFLGGLIRGLLRWLVRATAVFIVASGLLVLSLRWINPPTSAFMLQADGTTVPTQWTDWAQIGAALPKAVIAAEDQNFATHAGFDLEAIHTAIEEHQQGGPMRGASTISQQVAKNLFLWPGKNFVRKGLEAYFTVIIEALLSKRRILELYLNIAEFGPGVYGVGAASRVFFSTTPVAVQERDAALFAAVLPNPKRLHIDRPSDYVRSRQDWIAKQMPRVQIPRG